MNIFQSITYVHTCDLSFSGLENLLMIFPFQVCLIEKWWREVSKNQETLLYNLWQFDGFFAMSKIDIKEI